MSKQALLTPFHKNLQLKNRIVMAPMTRSRAANAENKPVDELHVEYYRQRASAGLIHQVFIQRPKLKVGKMLLKLYIQRMGKFSSNYGM